MESVGQPFGGVGLASVIDDHRRGIIESVGVAHCGDIHALAAQEIGGGGSQPGSSRAILHFDGRGFVGKQVAGVRHVQLRRLRCVEHRVAQFAELLDVKHQHLLCPIGAVDIGDVLLIDDGGLNVLARDVFRQHRQARHLIEREVGRVTAAECVEQLRRFADQHRQHVGAQNSVAHRHHHHLLPFSPAKIVAQRVARAGELERGGSVEVLRPGRQIKRVVAETAVGVLGIVNLVGVVNVDAADEVDESLEGGEVDADVIVDADAEVEFDGVHGQLGAAARQIVGIAFEVGRGDLVFVGEARDLNVQVARD